jgi:hypothetical protein
MIQDELKAVADVLRKLGYPPTYVATATDLLPELFPNLTMRIRVGLVHFQDPRGHRVGRTPTKWNETATGEVVDIGLPPICRSLGMRSRLPAVVMGTPQSIRRKFRIDYIPDGPQLRKRLSQKEAVALSRHAAANIQSRDVTECKNFLIALRDGSIQIGLQRVRVEVPPSLRDRADQLRPVSCEFRRNSRRALANRIGHRLLLAGEVGQVQPHRRCLLNVIELKTGVRLTDHLWVNVDEGDPGERVTLTGTVTRYEATRGPDFGLKDLQGVRVEHLRTPSSARCKRQGYAIH